MTNLIYKPAGRAAEYAEWACNLFRGCSHGCTYCYAPAVLRMSREAFGTPCPRKDVLRLLEKEARARQAGRALLASPSPKGRDGQGVADQVLLCFTTDPYQPEDAEAGITRRAIEILHDTGHSVRVLTKGGTRALRDLDLFTPADAFGVTLTCLSNRFSLEWEPGAALPDSRIAALRAFHEAGIPTWVSLEPVLSPLSAVTIIRRTHGIVDHWKIGAMNYHPHAQGIDWPKFAREVVATLEGVGAQYLLKDDLAKHLPGVSEP